MNCFIVRPPCRARKDARERRPAEVQATRLCCCILPLA